jgi:putative transposase
VSAHAARALDAGELELPSFTWAAGADPLNAATMAAIAPDRMKLS